MKKLISIIIIITFIIVILPPAHAQDSTPSADVKQKLEQLKQEIASKAAKLKQEINKKLTNKAYIGVVKSKTSASLTLAAKSATKIVSVNQDTTYQDTSTSKPKGASLQAIKEEVLIATLGDVDDTGVLTAKKVIILPTSNSQPKTILWGQVISVSDDLITIKDRSSKNQTVTATPSGKLKDKKSASMSDVENGDQVIVSGIKSKNDILEATFLYIIPKSSTPKPSISASSSTTMRVATPSGKKR